MNMRCLKQNNYGQVDLNIESIWVINLVLALYTYILTGHADTKSVVMTVYMEKL